MAESRSPEKVLFVWDELEKLGGVEHFLYQCLKWFPQYGLTSYVLEVGQSRGSYSGQFAQFAPFKDRIIRAPLGHSAPLDIKKSGLLADILRLGIRVIVLNSWEFCQILELPREDLTIPVVSIVHNDRKILYDTARLFQDRVSSIVAVSETISRKLKAELSPARSSIVRWIPHGVEPVTAWKQREGNRPLQLVYLGRILQYQKRIFDLVPFVDELNSLGVDCMLNLIGEGESSNELLAKLSERSGTVEVTFFGPLLHEQAMRQLSCQDIYLLFSEFEGLPITLLEALVRGVVPVVSQVPSGVSDILIEKVNARIFPIGRGDLAAKIVAELAEDSFQLVRLKKAAKELGAKFSIEKMCTNYADLLWAIIQSEQRQSFRVDSSKIQSHLASDTLRHSDDG
jgi:glycosyltransferase involved in cell wall biosynthesis